MYPNLSGAHQGYSQKGLEALAEALEVDPGSLLSCAPSAYETIRSIRDAAKPGERELIVKIATAIVGERSDSEKDWRAKFFSGRGMKNIKPTMAI